MILTRDGERTYVNRAHVAMAYPAVNGGTWLVITTGQVQFRADEEPEYVLDLLTGRKVQVNR